ncbi:glutaminyl-peptide cyclotransferase [Desulfobacterales bacterium HSG17]|nr:glutaminyl-peptide cyclotransferase [Desulfobacterales bacterium HSG17]
MYPFFIIQIVCILLSAIYFPGYADDNLKKSGMIKQYTYKIINTFPHNQSSWTQGLVFENNTVYESFIYESTGRYGHSCLLKVEPATGRIINSIKLDKKFYAEGLTIINDKLVMLTWHSRKGFVYNKDFSLDKTFSYPSQGWGLTNDGKNLIMSDGSCLLYFLSPDTFKEIRRIRVTENGFSVKRLNELEYIDNKIYANVWMTDKIVIISPKTGNITGWINLEGLFPLAERKNADSVLNGIAFDTSQKRLFVTGKLWPRLFEIKIIQKNIKGIR